MSTATHDHGHDHGHDHENLDERESAGASQPRRHHVRYSVPSRPVPLLVV